MSETNSTGIVVAGKTERSLGDFERACFVLISEEQEKILPDNHLISVLCDGVRIARELIAITKRTD